MYSKKQSSKINKKYFILGLRFTSMMVTPVLLFIVGGAYVQNRYKIGDWFLNICVVITILIIIFNLIAFARMAIKISDDSSKSRSNNEKR